MDAFLTELKNAVRRRSWNWKLVCCGGREEAFRAFKNAHENGNDAIVVLLVDAEGPVNGSPSDHLQTRDGWNLNEADDDVVHLMAQVMEAWIVADSEALSRYYGNGFRRNALPTAFDLETVAKVDIDRALRRATQETQKGRYHKIRHASDLLARIDSSRARQRCPHCERLFTLIDEAIVTG